MLALEVDRALVPALEEVTRDLSNVGVVREDAVRVRWKRLLGERRWSMASNLPYNIAVPITLDLLQQAGGVDPMLIMVQREVGERLIASPGEEAFGAVSLRVAYRADAKLLRRVRPSVFWPEPQVESVLVRIERRPPPVDTPEKALFRLVDAGFAQRRKTMLNALVRLGHDRKQATAALEQAELEPQVRAEELALEDLARLAEALDG